MEELTSYSQWKCISLLAGKLIVSCQASPGEPLCAAEHIKALALSALDGGAAGLRLEAAENIATVRAVTSAPIVGLRKSPLVADEDRLRKPYITVTWDEAVEIAEAGADIIAVDATGRPRPDHLSLPDLVAKIHSELNKPVWADISTLQDALAAAVAGVDIISTTMSGYTAETYVPSDSAPDLELLEGICRQIAVPVALEGRIWHPDEVRRAFQLGAFAVVVGSAITRPQLITQRFTRSCPQGDH